MFLSIQVAIFEDGCLIIECPSGIYDMNHHLDSTITFIVLKAFKDNFHSLTMNFYPFFDVVIGT